MLYPILHRLERLRPRRGALGDRRERPPPQVLRAHPRGPGPARRRTPPMGRQWTRRSGASGGRFPSRVTALRRPRCCSERDDLPAPQGLERRARGADRPVAELRTPPAGDPPRRRGRARGSLARAGRDADRGGARRRRGVPGRGEAHGQPRRPLARVRAGEHSDRLWKQLVVAPSDAGEPHAAARTDAVVAFSLAVAAAVASQGAGALRNAAGRGRRLLCPQRESLRTAPAHRVLRLEAAARPHRAVLGWRRRSSRLPSSATSTRSRRRAPPRRLPRSTSRSRSGWSWGSRTPVATGAGCDRRPWTSSASLAASSSSTTC